MAQPAETPGFRTFSPRDGWGIDRVAVEAVTRESPRLFVPFAEAVEQAAALSRGGTPIPAVADYVNTRGAADPGLACEGEPYRPSKRHGRGFQRIGILRVWHTPQQRLRPLPSTRSRSRRERPCVRRQRRHVARSTSSSDPGGEPEPPGVAPGSVAA